MLNEPNGKKSSTYVFTDLDTSSIEVVNVHRRMSSHASYGSFATSDSDESWLINDPQSHHFAHDMPGSPEETYLPQVERWSTEPSLGYHLHPHPHHSHPPQGQAYGHSQLYLQEPYYPHQPKVETEGKKREKRCLKLRHWLLYLLEKPDLYGEIIRWLDKQSGTFIFLDSRKVANMWGEKKKKKGEMTYEHMARALRHYYAPGIMSRVRGRRLVYKFGQNAEMWKQVLAGHPVALQG